VIATTAGVPNHRLLTLFLTRDASTFNRGNYLRVLRQRNVVQDVYVVSAEPLPVENNIVVRVPQHLPVPIRVGLSINIALKRFDLDRYTHIFKVDGDVTLPLDYCENLLKKGAPVAGRGAALLISVRFFREALKGKYPVNYCDDGYISALSIALGYWPPEYSGEGPLVIPIVRQRLREYAYGVEYYKWGFPFPLYAPLVFLLGRKDLASIVHNVAGYLHASFSGEGRYEWWRSYRRFRLNNTLSTIFRVPSRVGRIASRLGRGYEGKGGMLSSIK